jgi:type II secretory pathway component GspD/PulD (secretin)
MIFIRPKILRTPEQTAIESGAKYNHMLEEQRRSTSPGPAAKEDSPLLAPLAPRM